jgi:hypothetical protein
MKRQQGDDFGSPKLRGAQQVLVITAFGDNFHPQSRAGKGQLVGPGVKFGKGLARNAGARVDPVMSRERRFVYFGLLDDGRVLSFSTIILLHILHEITFLSEFWVHFPL